jgi:ABC-type proline/glycine betaine transport system permease subunit
VVVNVATGLATTEPELEDVLRTLKAKKLDILWNVGLPRAMPYFFASLKVAVSGKIEIAIDVRIAGTVPAPNQSTKIGTTAIFGVDEKPTSSGYAVSYAIFDEPIKAPRKNPNRLSPRP